MNASVTKDLSTKTACVEMSMSVQTLLTAVINTLSAWIKSELISVLVLQDRIEKLY